MKQGWGLSGRTTGVPSFVPVYMLPEKTADESRPHVSFLPSAQSWKEDGFPAERRARTWMQLETPLFISLYQQGSRSVLARSCGV